MFNVTIGNGAVRKSPGYTFPKREACLMAMSYSYELQAKVYDRMTALEEQARQPAVRGPKTKRVAPYPVLTRVLDYLNSSDGPRFHADFARKIGWQTDYLWRILNGHKRAGLDGVSRMIEASGNRLTPMDIRPDLDWSHWQLDLPFSDAQRVLLQNPPPAAAPALPAPASAPPMDLLAALSLRGAVFQMDEIAAARMAEVVNLAEVAIRFFPAATSCLEPIREAARRAMGEIGMMASVVGCPARKAL
jgi:hypothetical protein